MNTYASSQQRQGFGPVQMLDKKTAPEQTHVNQDEAKAAHAALLFTEALAAAHNAPDVRQDRIEAIRAQIENGTYEIDTRRLAESLIRENPGLFDE